MRESNCFYNGRVAIGGTNLHRGRAISPSSRSEGSMVSWCLAWGVPKPRSRAPKRLQTSRYASMQPNSRSNCSLGNLGWAGWQRARLEDWRGASRWVEADWGGVGVDAAPWLKEKPLRPRAGKSARCQCWGPPGSCPTLQARKGLRALEYKQGQSYWERIWRGVCGGNNQFPPLPPAPGPY